MYKPRCPCGGDAAKTEGTSGRAVTGVEAGAGIAAGELTVRAGCAAGEIFRVAAVTAASGPTFGAAACIAGSAALTLLKALRKAFAVWNRFSGCLAIAIRIISFKAGGREGSSSIGGFGISFTCAAINE